MSSRSQTLEAFWPQYLADHRRPADRWLHFAGTAWMLGCLAAAVAQSPVASPIALCVSAVVLGVAARWVEPNRPAHWEVVAAILVAGSAAPGWVALAVVGGYGSAWVGHFAIEGNRPAAFGYPAWSLLGDLRMTLEMAAGAHWRGDPAERSLASRPQQQRGVS